MSCPHIAWAYKQAKVLGLTTSARMLLLAIAEEADGSTMECHRSHRQLSICTGLSPRQIRNILPVLTEAGLVEITSRNGQRLVARLIRPDPTLATIAEVHPENLGNHCHGDTPTLATIAEVTLATIAEPTPLIKTPLTVTTDSVSPRAKPTVEIGLRPIRSGPVRILDDRRIELDGGQPCVKGWLLDAVFERVIDAAGLDPDKAPLDRRPVVDWLADDIEPDHIYASVKRSAESARRRGVRIATLAYFDKAVRGERVAMVA